MSKRGIKESGIGNMGWEYLGKVNSIFKWECLLDLLSS